MEENVWNPPDLWTDGGLGVSHFVISWWIFYYSNSVWSKIFQSPLCSVLSTAADRVQCVCQARTVLRLSAFYEYVILPPSNCSIFNFEIFSINIASSQASGMLWNFRQQFAWNVWMFISEILSSGSGRPVIYSRQMIFMNLSHTVSQTTWTRQVSKLDTKLWVWQVLITSIQFLQQTLHIYFTLFGDRKS